MKNIKETITKPQRKERVIQFGEGGFLRGFADWMLQQLNESGKWQGSVVIVQPLPEGMCSKLTEQNCVYTHIMRGMEHGQPKVRSKKIDVISRCINPYTDFGEYLQLAHQPELRFIISNTTEAGIAYDADDTLKDSPQKSFPAKLTALMYERFLAKLPGFILLPCELIEKNGAKLREIILRYAKEWDLGNDFETWIKKENYFCDTLVDRIVTGFPKNENLKLDYEDNMLDTSELFHLWVIEGDKKLAEELPLREIGLNVVWTDNLEPYRTRKVRILNGAHTSLVPYAMMKGFDTVKSCVDDPDMLAYIRRCIFDEIIPTLDLPRAELEQYAEEVLERFANPYIKHYLSSIALNSVSKFKVRVLPSILEYKNRFGKLPQTLIFAFAKLIEFYKTDMANDSAEIVEFMRNSDVLEILANKELWGENLSFMENEVTKFVNKN